MCKKRLRITAVTEYYEDVVSGEVARRRLRHSVLLFFMTPARLWREMGRRLGRHVDKANNG